MISSALTVLSDAELLDLVRGGDETAFTELYARHRAVAQRMAMLYCDPGEADDLVNVAFEKVLGALRRGRGPTGAFRAYLFVTLRRLAAEQAERPKEHPIDVIPEPVAALATTPGLDAAEREMITHAFDSLPDRWQAVLWHTAVEGRHPRDLSSFLGMSANAVSALAYRAREKLRQAYLQAHLQAAPHPQCEPHRSCLGAYVRDGQSRRERRATHQHVEECASCQALVAELSDVNRLLARAVLPIFMIGSVGKLGSGLGSGLVAAIDGVDAGAEVVSRSLRSALRLHHVGSVVGGVAATTALLVGLAELRPHIAGDGPVATRVSGTTLERPVVSPEDVAASAGVPTGDLAACDALGETGEGASISSAAGDSAAVPAAPAESPPGDVGVVDLPGLLGSMGGLLPSATTAPPAAPPNLAEVVCTPTEPGEGDYALVVAGTEISAGPDDAGTGLDVEVGGSAPVAAEVTIDLADGVRVGADVTLPDGCELAESLQSLTCTVDALANGALPASIVGLETEALEGSEPSATVTVTAGDDTVVSQTLDLTPLVGGLLP